MRDFLELRRHDLGEHVPVALEVVHFLLLLLLNDLVNRLHVDLAVWVEQANVSLHLILLLLRYLHLALLLARADEGGDAAVLQVLRIANRLDALLLILEPSIILHHLIVLSELVVADVDEVFFVLKHLLLVEQLVSEFDNVIGGLLDIMECDGESDDHELLLLDAGLVEDASLVELHELLLELGLDFDDLGFDARQVHQPLLALLLARVSHALLELLQSLLLIVVHLLKGLVHPLFADELLLELVFLFLEDELVATEHALETALAQVVTLEESLLLEALALGLSALSALRSRVDALASDLLLLVDLKDVLGVLLVVNFELLDFDILVEGLKQVLDDLILLTDGELLSLLVLFKLLELAVEVAFELENDLLEELDLGALAVVTVELIGLIDELENVVGLQGGLHVINAALRLHDAPVDLLHALDITLLALLGESGETSLLIRVSLARLRAQFALRDRQDWLEFAITILVDILGAVEVSLLLSLPRTSLLEDASGLRNGVIIHESGFARDTILDVVLEAAVVSFIDHLAQLLLHALQLLS
mmetsp:Transcript_16750/g.22584  ORF Transcript_16750/g.22584 Transcript_16750/m.22584 type:complete len:538 (-) Transcript_16750:1092-2705(-)